MGVRLGPSPMARHAHARRESRERDGWEGWEVADAALRKLGALPSSRRTRRRQAAGLQSETETEAETEMEAAAEAEADGAARVVPRVGPAGAVGGL